MRCDEGDDAGSFRVNQQPSRAFDVQPINPGSDLAGLAFIDENVVQPKFPGSCDHSCEFCGKFLFIEARYRNSVPTCREQKFHSRHAAHFRSLARCQLFEFKIFQCK